MVPWFTGCDKTYEGTIRFGTQTDTLDPLGTVVFEAPAPRLEQLEKALVLFQGDILQTPPLYSAIHINGHRAHELARSGQNPEMVTRSVRIHSLELQSFDGNDARIKVICSKGTYVRSLARDIALACSSRAHLVTLKRTAVAGFSLDEAIDPDAITQSDTDVAAQEKYCLIRQHLHPVDEKAFEALNLPSIRVTDDIARCLRTGRTIEPSWINEFKEIKSLGIFSLNGVLLAIISATEGRYSYEFVNPIQVKAC